VRVQIALGDLSNPASFRHALRGVRTVVHLAASIRDQERASLEELTGVATLRLLRAAERSGVERFVFFSAMGASLNQGPRFFRAKALAERAVEASELPSTVFAPSIVYSPGDPWLRLLERLSWLPLMPISGAGRALYQPVWAEDVADCVMRSLAEGTGGRYELAGPDALSYEAIVKLALRSFGRRRALLHVPLPLVRASLLAIERLWGESAFATWEEAELMEVPMTTARGTADAQRLGVDPVPMRAVLGAGPPRP
jgi:NADH dehydrogenase